MNLALYGVMVAVATVLWAFGSTRLPQADEIDFLKPIAHWITNGPRVEGLWHAPTYPWLLMYVGRINDSVMAARFLGLLSNLVAFWFLLKASYTARPNMHLSDRVLWALALVCAPVIVGSSLLLDYDTTLLVASTAAYMWFLVCRNPEFSFSYIAQAGALLGLCLISKETTPLVYPIGLLVRAWPSLGKLRAFIIATAALFFGVILFLLTTYFWCKAYGIHMPRVFDMDLLGLQVHSGLDVKAARPLSRKLWIALMPFIWIGPAVVTLFLDSTNQVRTLYKNRPEVAAVLSVVVTVIFCYSAILTQATYHYPKYMAPVMPWIFWIFMHARSGAGAPAATRVPGILVYALLSAGWFILAPNPLDVLHTRDSQGVITSILVWGIPLGVVYAVRPRQAALLALVLTAHFAPLKTLLFEHSSVTYWYGDTSLVLAQKNIELILKKQKALTVYSPAKDLAWALKKFGAEYEPRDLLAIRTSEICQSRNEKFLIFTRLKEDSSLQNAPELEGFRKCLKSIKIEGDLVIGANFDLSQ